jgi:hypothetical protein
MKSGPKPKPLAERFWPKVKKTDGCWLWQAADDGRPSGYGFIGAPTPADPRRMIGAHRASWMLHFGPIPRGKFVLHKCDNGKCVRPDHLFLGTHKENMRDMAQKGRASDRTGSKHHLTRLTEDDVRGIRTRVAAGESQRALAKEFGMHPTSISHIVHRRSWRHVA